MFERNTSISEGQWSNKGCRWWRRFRQVDLSWSGQPGLLLFCSLSKLSIIHSRFCGNLGHTRAGCDCCTVSQGRSKLECYYLTLLKEVSFLVSLAVNLRSISLTKTVSFTKTMSFLLLLSCGFCSVSKVSVMHNSFCVSHGQTTSGCGWFYLFLQYFLKQSTWIFPV